MAGPVAGTLRQALTLSANWHCEQPAVGLRYSSASIDRWILVSGKLLSVKRACTVNLLPRPQWAVYVFMYVFILIYSKHFGKLTRHIIKTETFNQVRLSVHTVNNSKFEICRLSIPALNANEKKASKKYTLNSY